MIVVLLVRQITVCKLVSVNRVLCVSAFVCVQKESESSNKKEE